MTEPEFASVSDKRKRDRMGGIAGGLALLSWIALAVLEVGGSNIGHSLVSRPERFFSNTTLHWPVVLLVLMTVVAEYAAARALIRSAGRPFLGQIAVLVLGAGLFCRFAMAALMPSDAGGYSVDTRPGGGPPAERRPPRWPPCAAAAWPGPPDRSSLPTEPRSSTS